MICQIGSSNEAVHFLDSLRFNEDIRRVSHVFAGMCSVHSCYSLTFGTGRPYSRAGRIDDKVESFLYEHERKLHRWVSHLQTRKTKVWRLTFFQLIETLFKPLGAAERLPA